MEQSGAWVQLSQKPDGINLQERVVTVSGEPEQSRKAVELIIQKIQEDPQSGSCLNISYANVTGPVANSNPTGSPYANTAEVLPTAAAAAGLLGHANLAGVAAFPAVLSGFTGNDLVAITSALNTLASYGYNLNTLGLGLSQAAATGALAAAAASANPAAAAAANLLATYASEASASGGSAGGTAGTFALGSLAAATAATNGYFGAASPLAASALLGSEKTTDGSKDVVEIAVPENLVGAILGKGGKTLVEYQELTGARIQISKKGEFVPGTRNRKVTITGTPAATQAAQYLITQRITYEQGVRAANPQKPIKEQKSLRCSASVQSVSELCRGKNLRCDWSNAVRWCTEVRASAARLICSVFDGRPRGLCSGRQQQAALNQDRVEEDMRAEG
ncbi:hypothetical protein JZ751_002703 [Albula glossodonta]|uniref:K Homology domain-containing protein n=1 Tax=Albula glossodonta TaxID=121402 RepID=A0A8T2N8U9_9TELE|nr:hypothetical protein JZ751_002703 [Albula glossodonta]